MLAVYLGNLGPMASTVSVVTPAMNVAPYIGTTIRSVLSQTHPDWSMVIVDDGSTDDTASVVAGFSDPRIRLVRQAHAGVSAARNRGLAEADGDAVLLLDGDDWLAPDALARLVAKLTATPAAIAAYGAFGFMLEAAEPGAVPISSHPGPRRDGDVLDQVLSFCPFAMGSVLVRRSAFAAAGPYRTDFSFGEDWDYWVRLALLGPFARETGAAPVAFMRRRASGTYLRLATDPTSIAQAFAAIFDSPELRARLGAERLAKARRCAQTQNYWETGRELIRHGRLREGRRCLRRSTAGSKGWTRLLPWAVASTLPSLLPVLYPQFRPYDGGMGGGAEKPAG